MAVNVTNPQNLTGRRKAVLEEEQKDAQKQAAQSMSMITAQADAEKSGVIDLTGGIDEGDGPTDVEVNVPSRRMRVNTTLDAVTIGHGTSYNFEEGQTYKVPESIYDYLDEKGFVWH